MGDQEFLDRENNWSLIFFLDNNHNWIRTHIVVNDWIVRINDAEFMRIKDWGYTVAVLGVCFLLMCGCDSRSDEGLSLS